MGTLLETNDTLQLTTEQGFPAELLGRRRHCEKPVRLEDLANKFFSFHEKPGARIFQLDPIRVYLVHNIEAKWLFWGRVLIQTETISKKLALDGSWKEGDWITSGTYKIIDIYDPEYQKIFTTREAPPGLSYFDKNTLAKKES
jgi:hypothetical protein